MTDPLESVSVKPWLRCVECERPWLDEHERWRLRATDDDPPQLAAYCPECDRREFGP
jgi:hypothetical protein